ncbi:MAG: ATP-binding cassette domain-containing protein [Acidobacteria bacterium]|nr:ATP-binding cassette domain-containing protein [Acidobacteriota bacterium]
MIGNRWRRGKSTLLNILGALDVPTAGKVFINNIDISDLDEDGLAHLRSEQIGFIFQSHYLLNEFTCLENALMPITIRHGEPNNEQTARVLELLHRVG